MSLNIIDISSQHIKSPSRWGEMFWGSHCITELFRQRLGRIDTGRIRKIFIEIGSKKPPNCMYGEFDQIWFTWHVADIDAFHRSTDREKKQMLLDITHESTIEVATVEGWDRTPFDRAYSEIIATDFQNEWYSREKAKSPNGDRVARVLFFHGLRSIEVHIVVTDRRARELARQHIGTVCQPVRTFAVDYAGKVFWEGNNMVILQSPSRKQTWKARFD